MPYLRILSNETKAANIHHVIEKLPAGYNTLIGEQGNKLSGERNSDYQLQEHY